MKHPLYLLLCLSVFAADLSAREVVRSQDGQRLVANLELAPGRHLSDGVVLMTHGTLAHGQMEIMAGLQAALKERGINTLSITLGLGLDDRHGMYDCATPHRHRHQDALQEIGGWLSWLQQQKAGPINLLGHSRGGNQTAWFAAEHPQAGFDSVILVAPATWHAEHDLADYRKRYHKELTPLLQQAQALVAAGKGAQLMPHTDFIYCPDTSVSAEAFVSYYQPEPRRHTPALLERIQQPVLVFAGSEDTVVEGLAEEVEPLIDDRIQLHVIEGADHFFRDLYTDEMADAIAEFLG